MNNLQFIMGKLLDSVLHNKKFTDKIDVLDWESIFEMALYHDIHSLLYGSVVRDGGLNKKLLNEWKENTKISVVRLNGYINDSKNIISMLTKNEISLITLKGFVLHGLYPEGCYRTMSDLDIIIQQEHFELAKNLLKELGYNEESSSCKHTEFIKKGKITVELHKKLCDVRNIEKMVEWEKGVWKNAITVNVGETSCFSLSNNDNIVYLFLHMINHYLSSGFGLRHLCDLVIFIETNQNHIDWEKFILEAKEFGIYNFVIIAISACKKLLGLIIEYQFEAIADESKIDQFIDDVFSGGVFGKNEIKNVLSGIWVYYLENRKRLPGRFLRIALLVFPPIRAMKNKFRYLKKYPVLLPIAWMHRVIENLARKGKVIKNKDDYKNLLKSSDSFKEKYELLKWLELI